MTDLLDIVKLKKTLQEFADARDWNKFHNPKNLSMALAAEAGELLEIFQWLSEAELSQVCQDSSIKEETSHELADILLYLTRLADALDINLSEAVIEKLKLNDQKYPVWRVKGSARKYDGN